MKETPVVEAASAPAAGCGDGACVSIVRDLGAGASPTPQGGAGFPGPDRRHRRW